MQYIFGKILEMSLIGGWCILLMLPVRLLLLRCGRRYAYYLWLAVFLRLLLPFGIQGSFSLIPKQVMELSGMTESEAANLAWQKGKSSLPAYGGAEDMRKNRYEISGAESLRNVLPGEIPGGSALSKAGPARMRGRIREIAWLVWMTGVLGIAIFNLFHMIVIKRRIAPARWSFYDKKERIAEVEGLSAPFLWGIWRPVIYLPAGLTGEERRYIVAHESCHRRRRDSLAKAAVFAAVTLHWFNPTVVAAWILFCRDMEVSCDEAVIEEADTNIRKQYAATLLRYAAAQNGYLMAPLTFGEPSVKSRIKGVLRFRKRSALLTGAAGLAAVFVAFGFLIFPTSLAENNFPAQDVGAAWNRWKELPGTEDGIWYEALSGKKEPDKNTGTEQEAFREEAERASMGAFEASQPESVPYDNSISDSMPHREGYVEASLTHYVEESIYFSPGRRTEEELDALAQRALRELYDLTGFQVEECVYTCTDLGSFYFARTENELLQSLDFYQRSFGKEEGYDELAITSMYIVNARRVWYSDVQQLDLPYNIEQMGIEERAVWFLQHSAVWRGGEIAETETYPEDGVMVRMSDGSFYEIYLDMEIDAVSHIYGPYPEGSIH